MNYNQLKNKYDASLKRSLSRNKYKVLGLGFAAFFFYNLNFVKYIQLHPEFSWIN